MICCQGGSAGAWSNILGLIMSNGLNLNVSGFFGDGDDNTFDGCDVDDDNDVDYIFDEKDVYSDKCCIY